MFNKKLYAAHRISNGETTDLGKYLLKPDAEAPLDFYQNFMHASSAEGITISGSANGNYHFTPSAEPDAIYELVYIPMDDAFWEACGKATAKEAN